MPQGTVKKVLADKGFGFIEGERGDLFFHHSAVEGTSIEALRVGQKVTYEEGRGPKGPRSSSADTRTSRSRRKIEGSQSSTQGRSGLGGFSSRSCWGSST